MILSPDVEVLEQGHIDLPIAGSPLAAVVGASEFNRTFVAVGTSSVIDARLKTGRCRRIGAKPIAQRSISSDQLAVLICAIKPIGIHYLVIVLPEDRDRKSGIEDGRGR